ncbi:DUF58 domain-containing protein [Pollutibacter soli]|uniref:DUF58 domain-containing protein n=1 Tax=Pollutibacter soli TaxID=3034157 RepID=UPI003013341B
MKGFARAYIKPLYFNGRFFLVMAFVAILYTCSFFFPWMTILPQLLLLTVVVLTLVDYIFLFRLREGVSASRIIPDRLSNGDENPISVHVENRYPFAIKAGIIDELPFQFQERKFFYEITVPGNRANKLNYSLRPVKRGEYSFGNLNIFVTGPLGLLKRRFQFEADRMVAVYPSFLQMRKYQLLFISNRFAEIGLRKIRKLGHSMEFEQIRDYVKGDDIRTMNWKATARRNQLMVNAFTDEKSQQIYCVIDKSRVMKMPFEGLSLLDYAINASLVLSNIALLKEDKAGLITYSETPGTFLQANRNSAQMNAILEVLYKQKTRYLESNYEKLYGLIRQRITQRSLIVLFTNFESVSSLQRQMKFLRKIAMHHLLLVVFFENTELSTLINSDANDLEQVYNKTIAEKFAFEKKMIVRELQQYGIMSILTAPKDLTINTVNKYLEIKARKGI